MLYDDGNTDVLKGVATTSAKVYGGTSITWYGRSVGYAGVSTMGTDVPRDTSRGIPPQYRACGRRLPASARVRGRRRRVEGCTHGCSRMSGKWSSEEAEAVSIFVVTAMAATTAINLFLHPCASLESGCMVGHQRHQRASWRQFGHSVTTRSLGKGMAMHAQRQWACQGPGLPSRGISGGVS